MNHDHPHSGPQPATPEPAVPGPDLARLARLAVLDPAAADAAALARRLQRMLDAVSVLHRADLDGVPPTDRLVSPRSLPREDDPTPWPGPDPLPDGAPRLPDGAVAIPAPRSGEEPA